MRSMTGYGRGEIDHNGTKFSVELNSVNRKQSDIVLNLPRDLAEVSVALQALPKDQRQALSHVTLGGLSYAETARLCSCKEGTIKSRVARARQRLVEAVNRACRAR